MTSREIRSSFLDFFASKGHTIVPSAPVIPHGDPTLLFTNAGMNQFKDVFLGQGKREFTRCADTQKCIRVSGKHNDLEEVGYDTYHHTLFEMLGNWSFGDYYKNEAIAFAWELLTEVWKLPKDRLHATVFRTDDEAHELWKAYLPESHIHRCDEKDNFWEMGDTGPCGPCSEIHFDRTPDLSGGPLVNAGVPEVIEIWNLVFIQYNRKSDGSLEDLAQKHVDTGMGFERICAVMQQVQSNYETDVFTPIIKSIEKLSKRSYSGDLDNKDGIAMRVIADHIRTLVFSIADGAMPGNEGRGYVLRRILRRACRYARNLGFRAPMMYQLTDVLAETMGDVFPEVPQNLEHIKRVIKAEEESFLQTLERGLERFEEIQSGMEKTQSTTISGADLFLLYDSFGFPADLTELLARERGLSIDMEGFTNLMNEQRNRSRSARKQIVQEVSTIQHDINTAFKGWDQLSLDSQIAFAEETSLITNETPFYAEMGGQISDTGIAIIDNVNYHVQDVRKSGSAFVHILDKPISHTIGKVAHLAVNHDRRWDIQKNHSATHLLHEALRRVLGNHVQQSGSFVGPDSLRFDFSHIQKVSTEELTDIQAIVNKKIRERIAVITRELPIEEARKVPHVKMFFGDKYGDSVRVVTIDESFSSEFCGGTHVGNTADIGYFHILSESSVASGIRRIEAISSFGIELYIRELQANLQSKDIALQSAMDTVRTLEKELSGLKVGDLSTQLDTVIKNAIIIPDTTIRFASLRADGLTMDEAKQLGDSLRNTLKTQGLGLIASVQDDKISLVCIATDDIAKDRPAGQLVGIIAKKLGGGGGGKPHMATAGAKDIKGLEALLQDPMSIFHS
ncbi:MAG: alanine--tRNA ligase [Candidatus Kapaibacteriota bacterium]